MIYLFILTYYLFKDEIFSNSIDYTISKIFDGKALFIKFYYIPGYINEYSPYIISIMPGIKEGISGAIQVGYNVGINANINKEKLEAAIEAVKFMTSREIQKELVLKELIVSGITSLYDEEDVCSNIRFCDFYKNSQIVMKPKNVYKSDNYYEKLTTYFYDFLYKNESAPSVLKKMEDLTKIYYISIDTTESYIGLVTLISYSCLWILILSSVILLYIKKCNFNYNILPKKFWYCLLSGILMILSSGYTKLEIITNFKCHSYYFLLSLGFTFMYVPYLYFLIITFPNDTNKYSLWVKNNKYLFFSIFVITDIILNGFTLIKPINIKTIFVDEGENYQICYRTNILISISIFIIIIYKFVFLLAMLLLIFIEWNILKIRVDIRLILTSIYLNIMKFSVYFLIDSLKLYNYISYYMIKEVFIFFISFSNFLTLYILRLLLPIFNKKDEDSKLFENFSMSFSESTAEKSNISSNISKYNNNNVTSKSLFFKILDYHKSKYTNTESSLYNNNNVISSMKYEQNSNNENVSSFNFNT